MKFVKAMGLLALSLMLIVATTTPSLAQGDKGTVYYLAPNLFDEFQTNTKDILEKLFKQLGYKVVTVEAQEKADVQLNQLDNAISLKPKAIILAAVNFDTIAPSIKQARAKGIPVMVFDRLVKNAELDFTSLAGTIEIGRMAGTEIVKMLKAKNGSAKGKVLSVMGDPGDAYTVDIEAGFQQIMKDNPGIKVVTKPAMNWEPDNAAKVVEDQLLVNKDIDVIFMHADHLAPPVVAVLKAKGYQKGQMKLLVSAGMPIGLQLLREGWMDVVVEQPLWGQAYGLAMFAEKVMRGEKLKAGKYDIIGLPSELTIEKWGPNLKVPGHVITKANVDDPANWGNLKPPSDPVKSVQ